MSSGSDGYCFAVQGAAMQSDVSKIDLVVRTIGAERGRAARGRPAQG